MRVPLQLEDISTLNETKPGQTESRPAGRSIRFVTNQSETNDKWRARPGGISPGTLSASAQQSGTAPLYS